MDETITYQTATVEDALIICELGQLLNAAHHAACPDIYTATTQDCSHDLPHWMNFFGKPGQVVCIRDCSLAPLGDPCKQGCPEGE